jgi:hypothetical protein
VAGYNTITRVVIKHCLFPTYLNSDSIHYPQPIVLKVHYQFHYTRLGLTNWDSIPFKFYVEN